MIYLQLLIDQFFSKIFYYKLAIIYLISKLPAILLKFLKLAVLRRFVGYNLDLLRFVNFKLFWIYLFYNFLTIDLFDYFIYFVDFAK